MNTPLTQPKTAENQALEEFSVRAGGLAPADFTPRGDSIHVALTTIVIGVAVVLRWAFLQHQSLWVDEGYSLWVSRFSLTGIWHSLENDASPPLYYFLLHYWDLCFGHSAFSIRGLSAFCGTCSIPVFYFLARKILADNSAVLLAMALYAVSFFQIIYANEARAYGLVGFLALASVYCLVCFLDRRSLATGCTLVLLIAASLYAHNMVLFYLPGLALIWFIYPAQRGLRTRLVDGLYIGFAVLVLYIPWISKLHEQSKNNQGFAWISTPHAHDLLASLCAFSGIDPDTLQTVIGRHLRLHRLLDHRTVSFTVLLAFLLCVIGGLWVGPSTGRRKAAAILAYVVTPVFLVFAASHLRSPIYIDRAFMGSSALLPITFCAPIGLHSGARRRMFQLIVLAVLAAAGLSAFGYLSRQRTEDWRGATQYLLNLPDKPRLVVVLPGAGQVLIEYYESRSSKASPAIEVTGLVRRFSLDDLEYKSVSFDKNTDILARLEDAITSGQYQEVDTVFQDVTPPNTLDYMAKHCASVEAVPFRELDFRRCSVRSASLEDLGVLINF